MTLVLGLLALIGYTLAATISAGEVALTRVTRSQAATLVAAGHPGGRRVWGLVGDPARVLAVSGFVRLLAEMTATVAVTQAVSTHTGWPWWGVFAASFAICAAVAWGLVRVSPRSLGRRRPVPTLIFTSRLLTLMAYLPRKQSSAQAVQAAREDEVRNMVAHVTESEVIEAPERQMVRSVLELGETMTREVMVPRTDMVTAKASYPVRKSLSLLLRSGFSRVPVVGENVDDLQGVLYLKDIVGRVGVADGVDREILQAPTSTLMRPARFVPEFKPVDELLRDMRDSASHMALVVDEYGGIAGLVTMEDALEEIVGEMTDEHDPSAPVPEDLGDGTFRVPARLGRDELGELFELEVEDEDVDTAGGLLTKAIGRVPIPGAAGVIHGLHLRAERVEGRRRRLATVIVRRATPSEGKRDLRKASQHE